MSKWNWNKCEESFTMEQTRRIDKLFYLMSVLESKVDTIVSGVVSQKIGGSFPTYRDMLDMQKEFHYKTINWKEAYENLLIKREFDRKIIDDLKSCKEKDGHYIKQLNDEITTLKDQNSCGGISNIKLLNGLYVNAINENCTLQNESIDLKDELKTRKDLYDNAISGNVKLKDRNKDLAAKVIELTGKVGSLDNTNYDNIVLRSENDNLKTTCDKLLRENRTLMNEKLKCDNDERYREWTEW
jgi:hypothetical protein